MNYKVVSGILGVVAVGCILQAFGLLSTIVNFINSIGDKVLHLLGG